MRIYLYASGEQVNGHERVGVEQGGPSEALWRSHGYVAEGEQPEPASEPVEAASEPAEAPEPAPAPSRRGRRSKRA